MLARLRGWFARRGAAWVRKRQGEDRLPASVHARRLYILPTRAGAGFAALLLVMLVAGLTYANSVALFLTFLLVGFAIVGMHLTHRNLLGLRITMTSSINGFAGETGLVRVTLANDADVPRLALRASFRLGEVTVASPLVELPARAHRVLEIAAPLEQRGRLVIERVRIATFHPFGLFEAWTWLHLPIVLLAYPVARGTRTPPEASHGGHQQHVAQRPGDEQWSHLRGFRDGDSPRQIAWRAYARTGQLLVKEYESPRGEYRQFSFDSLAGLPLEPRLEQLAAWVVAAHGRGERYGLQLPHSLIDTADGLPHRDRCLAALAVVGLDESPA